MESEETNIKSKQASKGDRTLTGTLNYPVTKPCNILDFSAAVKDVLIQQSLELIQVL